MEMCHTLSNSHGALLQLIKLIPHLISQDIQHKYLQEGLKNYVQVMVGKPNGLQLERNLCLSLDKSFN